MDFELSDEQTLLRDGLRELLGRTCDIRTVRAIAVDGDGAAPAIWRLLAENGWTALSVPEAHGGMGLDFEAVALAAMESGRALLPAPLTTSLLAARALSRSGGGASTSAALQALAAGHASITLALSPRTGAVNDGSPAAAARRDGDGWRLEGALHLVPYGPLASSMIVEATLEGGGQRLFLAPTSADGACWTPVETMDRTVRRFDLQLSGLKLPSDAIIPGEQEAIDRLNAEFMVVLAAESLGAAERVIEVAAGYVKERVQFGRPVGSNQAVKVRFAEMLWTQEQMRVAVYQAAMCVQNESPDWPIAVRMAKAASSAPGAYIGTQAIHVHGGIGFTWEHDAHLFFKRLKTNEMLLGSTNDTLQDLADIILQPEYPTLVH